MASLPALRSAERIVDTVQAALRAAIFDGDLLPGQPLSVPELSRQLDVSRSPVREAVLALVAGGLAVEQPRRGAVVAEIDAADLLEIHEVREGIEGQAARLCAERSGEATHRALADVLARQRNVVERGDAAGWYETNAAFHRHLAEGAGNRRLSEVLLTLEGQMRLGLRRIASEPEQRCCGFEEHKVILDAVVARTPDEAERLMRSHIRRTKDRLTQRLA